MTPEDLVADLLEDCAVNWDLNGIGSVPSQVDLSYFGFTRDMTAEEFRRLVPPGVSNEKTVDVLRPKAENGEPIAPPFLIVKWYDDDQVWQVVNHEGRSRSRLVCDHDMIPVSILPRGLRAKDIDQAMENAPLIPQFA